MLDLLERGVPKDKIELWHHDIDGGHPTRHMDWPVTPAYVRAVAEYLGITLRVSWRVNGFWGEVYRIGASWPIRYTDEDAVKECRQSPKQLRSAELREKILDDMEQQELDGLGHRMKFPAKSGDLATRWCSSILKITVAEAVIRNMELDELKGIGDCRKFPAKGGIASGRFCSPNLKREVADSLIRNMDMDELKGLGGRGKFPAKSGPHQGRWCSGSLKAQVEGKLYTDIEELATDAKILVVSGERRQESAGRAKYNEMEIHRTNATAKAHRLVHQWRSVIDWDEAQVWDILRRWHIAPHPCYAAGWNRCSCAMCIFGLPKHWAGIRELFPDWVAAVEEDERILGFTLDNKKTLREYIGDAESCVCHDDPKALHQLKTGTFEPGDVYIEDWKTPAGAFHGAEGGPC